MRRVQPPALLSEIRLPAFKSVRSSTLPLHDLTLLVGRNGSGKSNVLDGLRVLAWLAAGGEIRDRLAAGPGGTALRGGVEGCAPLGSDRFELGCTVAVPTGAYLLDVTVQVRPIVRVLQEHLRFEPASSGNPRTLLELDADDEDDEVVHAGWGTDDDGGTTAFRSAELATTQVSTRIPSTSPAGRAVHGAAATVLAALGTVFLLDPDPSAMRQYAAGRDDRLRPVADNLSAVLGRLLADPIRCARMFDGVRTLSESRVRSIGVETSTLGDVMVVLHELIGGREATVPARLMSDGTLRMLAILTALLDGRGPDTDGPTPTLVLEEFENGLHPSQAAALMETIVAASSAPDLRTIATTHSPAMLDALPGARHPGVTVCVRDEDGWTRLHQLTALSSYFDVVARGTLGDAAAADRLRPGAPPRSAAQLVDELFGD